MGSAVTCVLNVRMIYGELWAISYYVHRVGQSPLPPPSKQKPHPLLPRARTWEWGYAGCRSHLLHSYSITDIIWSLKANPAPSPLGNRRSDHTVSQSSSSVHVTQGSVHIPSPKPFLTFPSSISVLVVALKTWLCGHLILFVWKESRPAPGLLFVSVDQRCN